MRLLVMFDLPTTRKSDKQHYLLIRKFMLKDGYHMLQYSVYGRLCPNLEASRKHEQRIERYIKSLDIRGQIRLLLLTEKQYASMKIIVGTPSYQEKKETAEQLSLF